MPDFKWRGIPKCMIYFTVNEGEYHGYRARLAYNYNKDRTGPTFSKYSKFAKDAKKLFPNKFNDLSMYSIAGYFLQMGEGVPHGTMSKEKEWAYPPPESSFHSILKRVCNR